MLKPHLVLSSFLTAILSFSTAAAQSGTARSGQDETATVTASASTGRVRFTAPSSTVQIRLEVYDSAGRKLFDNELRGGNVLDWLLQDGQAEPLADGSYLCVVTVKSLSGKLTQRIGSVGVESGAASLQAIRPSQMTAQQAEAIGPVEEDSKLTVLKEGEPATTTVIAHNGEEGQITRGKGALSFRVGDFYSGKETEQMRLSEEGNLGIGVADPQAKLDVDGFIRATQGIVFPDGSIQFSASRKTYGPQSAGPGQFARHPQSGQEHFETAAAGTGTQNFIAKWTETGGVGTLGNSILFDNGTNVGIGTSSPVKRLDVRGGQLALDNSRFLYSRRSNGQFQEAFGIDSNDDIVFNRNSLVPGVDVDAPKASSALIFGTGAGRFMDIRNSFNVPMLRAVEATGNIGIGTTNPQVKLHVESGSGNAIYGYSSDGTGVHGYSVTGYGVIGASDIGYAGYFLGKAFISGNLGIGYLNPTRKLEVAGDILIYPTLSNGGLVFRNRSNSNYSQVVFNDDTDTYRGYIGYIGANAGLGARNDTVEFGSNGKAITFRPNETEVMRLTTDGKVRIGQVNGTPSHKLYVNGGSSPGVYGTSDTSIGVFGNSTSFFGVRGESDTSAGVSGYSNSSAGVSGGSNTGYGVRGISTSGYAGYFEGKVKVTGGDLFIAQPNSLVITSPNGSCWHIRVSDAGVLFAASIPCP